jgi:hypothetical protein
MKTVFQPPIWPTPQAEQDVVRLSWRLAGLTTLADWVSSRQPWFPYVTMADVADPARYFRGQRLATRRRSAGGGWSRGFIARVVHWAARVSGHHPTFTCPAMGGDRAAASWAGACDH